MKRVLTLACLLLAPGCAQIQPFLPTVKFGRLDVKALDWDHIETDFVFEVDNPNPVGIPLESFDYALTLADIELISGADPDGLELLAGAQSELALPVDLVFDDVYRFVETTRGLDSVPFGLTGSFGFDSPLGVVTLPYDAEGDFPALRTPVLDLGQLRLDALSLSSATLALDVDVDNDHGSTIWLEDFAYALQLEGIEVGDGLVPDFASVDGATTYTVSMPFEVDFLGSGQAVYDALTGGDPINVRLDAATDVTTPFEALVLPLEVSASRRMYLE